MNLKDSLLLRAPLNIVDLSSEGSNVKAKHRSAIIRIFGNSLYPLQQRDQGSKNLQFILEHETMRSSSEYLWVINRIVNRTESRVISNLLRDRNRLHIEFNLQTLKVLIENDPKLAVKYATDINNARNEALRHAAHNLDVDWLVLLDGNAFLTNEAYDLLHECLENAELNQQYLYFIPMYRLSSNQDWLTPFTEVDDITSRLSGLQEPYLAIHRLALNKFQDQGVQIFSSEVEYGKRSKIASLEVFNKFYYNYVGCLDAYHESSVRKITSPGEGLFLANRCSYAIRLLYWPSGFSDSARSDYSFLTNLLAYKGYIFDGNSVPEENNLVRTYLRHDSIRELERNIAELVKTIRN